MHSHATVVVLGDIGRSPRMQYHALSLAEHYERVVLLGYAGTPPLPEVEASDAIEVRALPPPPSLRVAADTLQIARMASARGVDTARLLRCLWAGGRPELVLLQNPPALPTQLLGLEARRRGAHVVIDWHNFSHAMLALKLGDGHVAVRALRTAEAVLARGAHAHLCVSRAMSEALRARFAIADARVLYDRPLARTFPPDGAERQRLRASLAIERAPDGSEPALLVCPTSFGLDEDLSLLIDAARAYRARLTPGSGLRAVCLVVTGSGPARTRIEATFREQSTAEVQLRTGWLPAGDYRKLLASADLGLCLHASASGLDLPMKVADMFGAGLPVCMLDYGPVVREQVGARRDVRLFRDVEGLVALWLELLARDAGGGPALREAARVAAQWLWRDEWHAAAAPLLVPPG